MLWTPAIISINFYFFRMMIWTTRDTLQRNSDACFTKWVGQWKSGEAMPTSPQVTGQDL